jgi:methylmalonyl-CoA/ethylmalonyl-CoA epimerase
MRPAKLHHVVFCVRPENHDAAAALWRDLGVDLQDFPLEEEGLRVLLDWSAGIEVISPSEQEGTETARFREWLDEHGEGVYSVVVRTIGVEGAISAVAKHGMGVRYQQHREHGERILDEVDLSPAFGMPLTLLSTNTPD